MQNVILKVVRELKKKIQNFILKGSMIYNLKISLLSIDIV